MKKIKNPLIKPVNNFDSDKKPYNTIINKIIVVEIVLLFKLK